MIKFIKKFRKEEEGAVTVDWVVLTAAVVGLGVAGVSTVVTGGSITVVGVVITVLSARPISLSASPGENSPATTCSRIRSVTCSRIVRVIESMHSLRGSLHGFASPWGAAAPPRALECKLLTIYTGTRAGQRGGRFFCSLRSLRRGSLPPLN